MIEGLRPLTAKVGREMTRNEILEAHAFHESSQQAQTPGKVYRELLPIVYKRLAEQWGVSTSHEECLAYGRSIRDWPAFEDSAGALQHLKRYYKLVILSNVDNESFSFSNKRLLVDFDAVITAEDIGAYKPSDTNFEYMIHRLGRGLGGEQIRREEILHTAESLFHDHRPANRFGLASCWIYRRHQDEGFGATMNPGEKPRYDFRFTSMAEFAKAHQEHLRSR